MIFLELYEGPYGASKHRLNIWGCGHDDVSFCIFNLLRYDRIFGVKIWSIILMG